jgi:hypothetical protein
VRRRRRREGVAFLEGNGLFVVELVVGGSERVRGGGST